MSTTISSYEVISVRVTPIHEGATGGCWRDIEVISLAPNCKHEERITIRLYADNRAQLMLVFDKEHPHV